jgi:2-phosphoglycerate kinase
MEKVALSRSQGDGWHALLIGGISGTGKTTVARQLGLCLGLPWLQVDDLRLSLQWSHATLPHHTDDLYFFLHTPNVWQLPAERLCQALVTIGEILSPALEVVVASHLATAAPIIIEGDGIIPSILTCPDIYEQALRGEVQAVFLVEEDEDALFQNMVARDRGIAGRTEDDLRAEAHAKWLYGQWLTEEARHLHLPVLAARPWSSLIERILIASHTTNFSR